MIELLSGIGRSTASLFEPRLNLWVDITLIESPIRPAHPAFHLRHSDNRVTIPVCLREEAIQVPVVGTFRVSGERVHDAHELDPLSP